MKERKLFRRSCFVVAYLLFMVFLYVFSSNISQNNNEDLFISLDQSTKFHEFQNKYPQKDILVGQIELVQGMNHFQILEMTEKLQGIKKIVPELSIILGGEIYPNLLNIKTENEFSHFLKKMDTLSFPLLSSSHYSVIFLKEKKISNQEIKKIINFFSANPYFTKGSIKYVGFSYINYLLDEYSIEIKERLFPLVFIISLIALSLFLKNIFTALVIFIPSLASALFSLTLIKLGFKELNMIISIVPIMVFSIMLSVSLHLYLNLTKEKNILRTLKFKGPPLFLMIATTCIGFGSLFLSEILVIRQFSYLSVLCILLGTFLLFIWFLILYGLKKEHTSLNKEILGERFFYNWFDKKIKKKTIFIVSMVIFILGCGFLPKIKVLTNAMAFFPKEISLQENFKKVSEKSFGIPLVEVVLSKNSEFDYNDFLDLRKIENHVIDSFGPGTKVISRNALTREANILYSGEIKLPDSAMAYASLGNGIPEFLKEEYPIDEFYRISITGMPINSDIFFEKLEHFKELIKDSPYQIEYNGAYFNIMNGQRSLVKILGFSFFGTLLIISFLSFLYFKKIKFLTVFFIVNLAPICVTFFMMYLFDISFNVASIMAFSVSLGIIVDSTIHFSHTLYHNHSYKEYFSSTLVPILLSGICLIVSFFAPALSPFVPIRDFGIALVISLLGGLFYDIFALPNLLLDNDKSPNL